MGGGLADHCKEPCIEAGFSSEHSFSAEHFQVNQLKDVFGFIRPSTASAKRPAVAFGVMRFKSVAQRSVVEGQRGDIGTFRHVAQSGDRLVSYAEHQN